MPNSRLFCSLYYFWEDKYFPNVEAHSARKGGPSSVRQWERATKTSEIPNEPPNILMPVNGHRLSREYFISIRTHSFCFKKVNNSMLLLIISYLHWESLFEAHCGFNVYRDLSIGLKIQETPVPVFCVWIWTRLFACYPCSCVGFLWVLNWPKVWRIAWLSVSVSLWSTGLSCLLPSFLG